MRSKAKLFDRSPSGYTLTEQGRRLMPLAEEMERLALGARRGGRRQRRLVEGVVRIGSPEGFGSYFLAPRIAGAPGTAIPQLRRPARRRLGRVQPVEARRRHRHLGQPPAGGPARSSASSSTTISASTPRPPISTRIAPIARPADLTATASSAISATCSISPSSTSSSRSPPGGRPRSRAATSSPSSRATLAGAGLCVLPAFLAGEEPGLVRVLPDEVKPDPLALADRPPGPGRASPGSRRSSRFIKDEVQAGPRASSNTIRKVRALTEAPGAAGLLLARFI